MSIIEIVIDGVLLLLLFAALWVGTRVHQRLIEVREAQTELGDLVGQLDRATEKAQTAVGELRQAGAEAREILSGEMGRARALADELSLIAEAGDSLASRLEVQLTTAGGEIRARKDEQARSNGHGRSEDDHRTILEALKDAR
ncbi:MAG: DUF6468 domain-containing protein [Rhodothalassiaceae bacterium]